MLDIIYMILDCIAAILASIYLIVMTAQSIKKSYSTVKGIKTRIVFTALLCILFVLQVILSIILQRSGYSLGIDIFCAVLWALNTALGGWSLKEAQDGPSIEVHIIVGPCIEDDEVEEKAEKVTEENTRSESNR